MVGRTDAKCTERITFKSNVKRLGVDERLARKVGIKLAPYGKGPAIQ